MATLHIEDFDDELYEALRKAAEKNRTSIAAEITAMVKRNFPTEAELTRHAYFKQLKKIHEKPVPADANFPSTEQMLREDRDR